MTDNAAGWQPDPTGKHDHRYWDGTQWTDNVADGGVAGTDPYVEMAADPTSTFAATPPAPPPPYVPPSPVGGGDAADGGSQRRLLIGGAIVAAVAAAVVAFLLLGGDDESDVRAQLASAMRNDEDFELSDSQADCIADLVVDEAGEDAFKDTNFDAEDPPPEFIDAVLEIGPETFVEECGIEESAFGGSPDGSTDGSSTDTDEGDPQTTGGFGATDDMESIIADTYEEIFGISRDKAECLAGKISEAIENGDLTEEQAMTEIFEYLADCDISMEEISGN